MSVQNGDVVILQIGGVQLGALVSNSQNMTADMLDGTSKDDDGVKQFEAGEDGWGLSVEALWDPAAGEGFSEALGYLKAGTEITVLHGVTSTQTFSGTGLISSIDVAGPKNEIASYSLEIQGTGIFGGYSSEYQTVYDAMTNKPTALIAENQDVFVRALVSAGVWAKLDVLYILAQYVNTDSEALLNWMNPGTNDATIVNAPTFVSLEGFTGNGSTQYINTNFNPSVDGSNYIQDSASVGVYIRNNVSETEIDVGATDGGNAIRLGTRTVGDQIAGQINENGAQLDGASTDSRGFTILARTASNARAAYKNGSSIDTDALASAGVPNINVYALARNDGGSPGDWTTRQASVVFLGGALIQADVTAFTNAVETYMDSNSKGVIT